MITTCKSLLLIYGGDADITALTPLTGKFDLPVEKMKFVLNHQWSDNFKKGS
jgi:hypothetical protein